MSALYSYSCLLDNTLCILFLRSVHFILCTLFLCVLYMYHLPLLCALAKLSLFLYHGLYSFSAICTLSAHSVIFCILYPVPTSCAFCPHFIPHCITLCIFLYTLYYFFTLCNMFFSVLCPHSALLCTTLRIRLLIVSLHTLFFVLLCILYPLPMLCTLSTLYASLYSFYALCILSLHSKHSVRTLFFSVLFLCTVYSIVLCIL